MKTVLILSTIVLLLFAFALAFGGPSQPPAMDSINNPFRGLDYAGLPAPKHYRADDGAMLAYRQYDPSGDAPRGSVVLLHGSSADSRSMHPMAMALSARGWRVYSVDVRGHGGSGDKGRIDYIGELEDDLDAFVREVKPPAPSTLAGFSSGGGFVLRFAGSARQDRYQSYLLLSPFISQDSPTQKPGSGGWVTVGLPRLAGLVVLNAVGVKLLNDLPVTRFALSEEAQRVLTPAYSYNLSMNYRPQRDFMDNLRSVKRPCAVLAGSADEAFHADRFEALVRSAGQDWPVQLLPGIGHISLILGASTLQATGAAIEALQKKA
jgi:alpha-beta hydrolase superfamily lysophospholipase